MPQDSNTKTIRRTGTVTRLIKWGLLALIALVVLVILLLPVVLSSDACRRFVISKINGSIDGKADFGNLSVGWLKGIRVADFSFADNAGRTAVTVKRISTLPHYGAILMGNMAFGKTVIDEPRVEINLAIPAGGTAVAAAKSKSEPAEMPVKQIDLIVNNGSFKVSDVKARTVELSGINSRLDLRPAGQPTSLQAAMTVLGAAGPADVRATAKVEQAGKGGWSLKNTTGSLTVEVNDLQLESLVPIFALAGVEVETKGSISADVRGEIKSGQVENITATVKGKNLDIGGPVLKGDKLHTAVLDVVIRAKSENRMLSIDKLEMHTDWASVTAHGAAPISLRSIGDLLKPEANCNMDADFNCNVATVLSQMPHTLGLKEGMQMTSGNLAGEIHASTQAGKAALSGQAKLSDIAGTLGEKKLSIAEPITAEIKASADKDKMSFDRLQVSAAFAKINAAGSMEQVNYDAKADLAKLQAELGQFVNLGGYKLNGELSAGGQVSVKQDKTAATGTVDIKDLQLAAADGNSVSEPKADLTFALGIDRKNSVITVDSMQLKASFGTIEVTNAAIPFGGKQAEPMKMAASLSKVDLAKLQPFAVMFASFPKQMQLAGIADAKVAVTSEKGKYHITADDTKIAGLKVISPGKAPFEQEQVTLILDAEIDPAQKAIDIRKLQLDSPQIKIKKGELQKVSQGEKTKVRGNIDCEYDWSAISAVAAPFLPKGLTIEGHRSSAVAFASEYPTLKSDEMLAHFNAKATAGFDKAAYMGLNLGRTDVDIQMDNGLLKIAPFSTTANNGQLSFAAQADFTQKPTILKMPGPLQVAKDVQITPETAQKLLAYLSPIFSNAVNVSGIASFHCEKLSIPLAGATKDQAEIVGTVAMSKIRIQSSDLLSQILAVGGAQLRGQELTIQPTKFALEKGVLRYEDMEIDIDDNPLNFKGAIGLDKSLNMTVTLPYTVAGRTVRVGQSASDRISVSLKGTIDKPQLDVGKTLEDQLFKGLEGLLKRRL